MTAFKKTVSTGLAAIAVTACLFAGLTSADARDGRNAALFGGLAAGAIIGGALLSSPRPDYYEATPSYRPSYVPAYGSYDETVPTYRECYRQRRAVYDDWGDFAGYRTVRICE